MGNENGRNKCSKVKERIWSHPHTWHYGTPRSELLCYEPSSAPVSLFMFVEKQVWFRSDFEFELRNDRRIDDLIWDCVALSLSLIWAKLFLPGTRLMVSVPWDQARYSMCCQHSTASMSLFFLFVRASGSKNSPIQCGRRWCHLAWYLAIWGHSDHFICLDCWLMFDDDYWTLLSATRARAAFFSLPRPHFRRFWGKGWVGYICYHEVKMDASGSADAKVEVIVYFPHSSSSHSSPLWVGTRSRL